MANSTNRNPHSVTLGASNEVLDSINPICLLQCGDQEAVSSIKKLAEKGMTDKDPPLEPWIDKKTTTLMKHFCEPITVSSNEKICAPTCCPFNKSCNRGGRKRLRQLKREARIWSCYVDQNQWELNYRKSINSNEDIGWTSHFCTPALKKDAGITQAWPTCDPSQKECDGGSKVHGDKEKRYEWACFYDTKRGEIGYLGISFNNWLKVKFGETKLSDPDRLHHRE